MTTLSHKNYRAHIEFDPEDALFVGRIAGINDIAGFHGENVAEVTAAFREAIDDYVETCRKVGKKPDFTQLQTSAMAYPMTEPSAVAVLDPARRKALSALAEARSNGPIDLLNDAVDAPIEADHRLRAEVEAALREADAGDFASADEITGAFARR